MTDEIIFESRGRFASFKNVGDKTKGRITALKKQEQTFNGVVQTDKNGRPKQEILATVETAEGPSLVSIKGGLEWDVRDAVQRAGAKGLKVGGDIDITRKGSAKMDGSSFTRNTYDVEYVPPAGEAAPKTDAPPF